MPWLISALASLFPVVIHAGKALVDHFLGVPGGPAPATFTDELELQQLQLQKLQVLDQPPPNSYRWINGVVALQRPLVVLVLLGLFAYHHLLGTDSPVVDQAMSAIGFYLFGDATMFAIVRRGKHG